MHIFKILILGDTLTRVRWYAYILLSISYFGVATLHDRELSAQSCQSVFVMYMYVEQRELYER